MNELYKLYIGKLLLLIQPFLAFTVDITVYHNGFHGDLNETFFVGDVDEKSKELVAVTHKCLQLAIDEGE